MKPEVIETFEKACRHGTSETHDKGKNVQHRTEDIPNPNSMKGLCAGVDDDSSSVGVNDAEEVVRADHNEPSSQAQLETKT